MHRRVTSPSSAIGKSLGDGMLHEPLLLAGLGMMIVGLGFKLSLVPFHLWTPDVYRGAPAPVSTFTATASKIAIFGVVMRLFLYAPVGDSEAVRVVLGIIAFVSIIFGNLMALSQTNIKRLLGYSSISHLGYLLVALIALQSGEMSMETVGVYLAGYLFSSLGAFGVVSLMSSPYRGPDADSLFSYRGLFWHRPILSAVMTVMMLSTAGIPMTTGFIGKFYVTAVGVQAGLWWLTAGVVIGSAIGLYYYLRVAVSLYLSAPQQLNRDAPSNWQYSAGGIVVLISALLVLIFGIYPQPLIDIVQHAMPLINKTRLGGFFIAQRRYVCRANGVSRSGKRSATRLSQLLATNQRPVNLLHRAVQHLFNYRRQLVQLELRHVAVGFHLADMVFVGIARKR